MKPGILFLPHGNLQYSQLPIEKRGWVARESYGEIFALAEQSDVKIAFEASGETLEIIAAEAPDVLEQLREGIRAGRIEPVASPQSHIMMANVDEEIALNALRDGLETWERLVGVRPVAGWNPECSWASYLPEVYRKAGFEILICDADSYLLSAYPEIREATGLSFDVRGHSNKNALFKIEQFIADKPEIFKQLFRPHVLPNGLKVIFRTDMMCNILLWFLMGATEGNRQTLVTIEEVRGMLERWRDRIGDGNGFLMPYAEDAEYVGTTAYFFVKQFGLARFFEPAPESIERFAQILQTARELGFEFITPSETVRRYTPICGERFETIENGVAWHGGTAKAWANTVYSRVLDPVCVSIQAGLKAIAKHLNIADLRTSPECREVLRCVTTAYLSDSRWPPAPTSPGRFNVEESLVALERANAAMATLMQQHGLSGHKALYSPTLMATQIAAVRDELMAVRYFGEPEAQP